MGVRAGGALTLTDDALLAYVRDLVAREDQILRAIRDRQEREGFPAISISPEEAQLLVVLARAVGARRVLEVGTLGGYSAVWLARALPADATLLTIERDCARARVAREHIAAAGLGDRVEVIVGEALETLEGLTPPFDVVFLDADKEPLEAYYRQAMRLLRPGGLLLVDNAFMHGRVVEAADTAADVEGVRTLNRLAATDPRLVTAIVPIRDGLTVGVKVAD